MIKNNEILSKADRQLNMTKIKRFFGKTKEDLSSGKPIEDYYKEPFYNINKSNNKIDIHNNFKINEINISNFDLITEKTDKNFYWFYHSNFILEEDLIKKIFCTWTPFYLDLNVIINKSIEQKKEIINFENKYIIDLKNFVFYTIKDPKIRRYIYCIDLNEKYNLPIKRIFRCSQNIRINKFNLLENLNGMEKIIDWYYEKYSKLEDKKLFKYKDIFEIIQILEKEYNKEELDLNKKEFDDLITPIEKKFRVNPYLNYTKKIRICDLININFNENFLIKKKYEYEVSNINIFREIKIPKFNNEIFYKEFIIPYWIIDQIKSFKNRFNHINYEGELNKFNLQENFFEKIFYSLEDIIAVLKIEIINQFDLFINYYEKILNISNKNNEKFLRDEEILKKRNNFSMDFPQSNDTFSEIKDSKYDSINKSLIKPLIKNIENAKKKRNNTFKGNKFINKNNINKENNSKNNLKGDSIGNNKYQTFFSKGKNISNPKNREKILTIQKSLKDLYKKQEEFNKYKNIENSKPANITKLNGTEGIINNQEYNNKDLEMTFENNDFNLNKERNTLFINKNSILIKYKIQKDEYLKNLDEINNENFSEKLVKIFTMEGEIFNIVNASLKNQDFLNCKLKLYILLLLSIINNLSKSNSVNFIQKLNLCNLGEFPKNNNIYNLSEDIKSHNFNNKIFPIENIIYGDLSKKPQIQINKYLSVLILKKPKLKVRLYRNFEPSVEFFKKIVYSYKFKKSNEYIKKNLKIEPLYKIENPGQNKTTYISSQIDKNKSIKSNVKSNYSSYFNNKNTMNKTNNCLFSEKNLSNKNIHKDNNNIIKDHLFSKENIILSQHYNINLEKLGELKNIIKDSSDMSLMKDDKNKDYNKSGDFTKPLYAYHQSKNERDMNILKFDKNEILFNKYIRFDEIFVAYYDEEKFLLENLLETKAKFQIILEFDFEDIIKNNCSFAFIEEYSVYPSEKEVLISPHYVYKIKDIQYVELEKLSKFYYFFI